SRQLPRNNGDPIEVTDAGGVKRKINGLFVALSFDDGKTWPTRRLVTAGGPPRQLALTYGTHFFMDESHGEPQGYLAVCQTADGLIHLITSQREYIFNMAWLKTPMPAAQPASLVPSRGRMLSGSPAPPPNPR
ncbi:MAG TPA: hypothetical protein VFJ52_03190, partial [Terriglobia bacterium]|nr:hypothetical protein [Terriglobia bacterium]